MIGREVLTISENTSHSKGHTEGRGDCAGARDVDQKLMWRPSLPRSECVLGAEVPSELTKNLMQDNALGYGY